MIYFRDNDITVRDILEKDVIKLFQWWVDESINTYDPRPLPNNAITLMEECNRYCNAFQNEVMNEDPDKNKYKYFMIDNSEGEAIGFVNLFSFSDTHDDAELGIIIGDKNYWNKGIGKKSCQAVLEHIFDTMKMRRVRIETGESNKPARRLFNSLGFTECDDYMDGSFKFIVMEILSKCF